MTDVYVKSFTHLQDRHRADDALKLLQRVASLVKPIMRKRGWVLPVLAEFYPDNPNLLGLNINMGQKILVRLRPHFDPNAFFPEADVLHTMLHELTHNVHGPHDDTFYKYLAGLESEYEDLRRSGYSGEGFHSAGVRLGVGTSHNLPPHLARLKALEAAEKRRRAGGSGGGRRLGGGQTGTFDDGRRQLTPRELALRAAERRKHDNTACASGIDAQREAEKAAKESVERKTIDLTMDSDGEVQIMETTGTAAAGPSRLTHFSKPESRPQTIRPPAQTLRNITATDKTRSSIPDTPLNDAVRPGPMALPWTCENCTLINEPLTLSCDACLSPPPRDPASCWICLDCGAEMENELWMCRLCDGIRMES